MYTRQERSKQKQAFWTAFGQYMKPVLSAEGTPVTWVNYKTGIPGVQFKMETGDKDASIAIVLSANDTAQRHLLYERFTQLKMMLQEELGEDDWTWQPDVTDEYDRTVSMIHKTLPDVQYMRQTDWSAMISFLKPRMIALDAFWSFAKTAFADLL